MKPAESPSTVTDVPTIVSPIRPEAGDIVMRHLLSDGGRLIKIKRGPEVHYHLKLPDGRQIFLEKKTSSMVLLMTDSRGKAVNSLACDL